MNYYFINWQFHSENVQINQNTIHLAVLLRPLMAVLIGASCPVFRFCSYFDLPRVQS